MIGDRLSVLLCVLVLSLGAVATWQLRFQTGGSESPMIAPVAAPRTALPPISAVFDTAELAPLDEFAETLERPLFSRTRRPTPAEVVATLPEPAAAESTSLAPLALELSAVVLEPERRFALFRQSQQGALIKAEIGESVDGWVVNEIRSDAVNLSRGSERQELVLRTFKAALPKPVKAPVRKAAERAPVPAAGQAPTAGQAAPAAARRPRRALRGPRRRSIQRQQQAAPAQP